MGCGGGEQGFELLDRLPAAIRRFRLIQLAIT